MKSIPALRSTVLRFRHRAEVLANKKSLAWRQVSRERREPSIIAAICRKLWKTRQQTSCYFEQNGIYPYPLGAGSARPNPKMGAPDPENPLFLGFSVLRGGLRPWSQTVVSEGARPWGRGRSGDCDISLAVRFLLSPFPRNSCWVNQVFVGGHSGTGCQGHWSNGTLSTMYFTSDYGWFCDFMARML